MERNLKAQIGNTLQSMFFIRKSPGFWEKRPIAYTVLPDLLVPFSVIYYAIMLLRNRNIKSEKLSVPVICAGNLTVGGAGKTPLAMKIAAEIKALSKKNIAFISRGYMADIVGPLKVDPSFHNVEEVGDEALLLARKATCWIGKDRVATAKAAIADGAEILIMDDGFQNNTIEKDVSLIAIDGGYGIGNALVIPAGPLREPLLKALKRVSAIVFIGEDKNDELPYLSRYARIIKAKFVAKPELFPGIPDMVGKKVLAFAGIGRPQKFFDTLTEMGVQLLDTISFPDHYLYDAEEIDELLQRATKLDAMIITTEKDYVRLPSDYQSKIKALPVELELGDRLIFDQLLKPYI